MLKLYNVNKEKIEGLTKYKDLVRERDLKKGEDTLSFSYPKKLSKNIKEECYIETKFNFYVIKEIDNSSGDWIGVIAKVNIEGLKSNSFPHFEMVNSKLQDTLNLALAGTGWTIGHNNIIKRRTVRVSNSTPLEIINEIRKAYRAEIFYDAINKKVNVYEKLGEDKGDFFMEDVNLKSLNISSDSYDYVTRLIPLGKDGLTIEEINNGKKYVENYQYSDKIIYATWEDNRYTVVENLKEDAISKLEELSKPYKSYEADVVDLRGANLGDTITLISKENGVKEKQRVVKITEYPDEFWNNKVEIANKTYTFEEMQSDVMDTVETADTVLTSDGMVDESKIDLNPIRQEFVTIIAEKADIVDLNAALIRVGELEATKANITDLDAINARIDNLDVEDLEAINADITFLKVKVGEIDHLLAGNITAENIAVGAITAGSGIIADGAIGDAQINAVTAGKIKSGTLDTSLVTVAGADGKLNITGNRLQVIHNGLERVALGDVNRDGTVYGLRVRGQDGQTVLFDERGLTREGLTDGAVDDSKIDDAANIQGHKLDINSVIREVNNADETIKGTRVQIGDRSLDVELSTQRTLIDDNTTEINNQKSEINALDDAIKLKVDNQTFNQYMTTNDNNITTINTQLSKNTASINILQEEINLKVSQTDVEKLINEIVIVGRNLFLDTKDYGSKDMSVWNFSNGGAHDYGEKFNGLNVVYIDGNWKRRWQTVEIEGGETYTLSCWVKSLDEEGKTQPTRIGRFGDNDENSKATILEHHNMSHGMIVPKEWTRIGITFKFDEESTVSRIRFEPYCADYQNNKPKCLMAGLKLEKGAKMTDWTPAPEDIESEITAINTKVAGMNINLDSITERVSSTESKIININDEVSTIESRISTAERKITDSAIVETVRESTAYINDLDGKANESDLNATNNRVTSVEQTSSKLEISVNDYKNGKLSGATYTFDGQNATFRDAGLKILNKNNYPVLESTTDGYLKIMAELSTGYEIGYNMVIVGNSINFMYARSGEQRHDVGNISAGLMPYGVSGRLEEGISLIHSYGRHISIGGWTNTGEPYSYLLFDRENRLGYLPEFPAIFLKNVGFYHRTKFLGRMEVQDTISFETGFSNKPYIFAGGDNGDWLNINAYNYALNGPSGAGSPRFQYQASSGKSVFFTNMHVNKDFTVSGKKNALHTTKNYGDRLINSYEMAEYYSGDLGSGKLDKNGECYIYIDDIFGETINTDVQYHVFLQKLGQGDLWIEERNALYFVVKGTPNLRFSWELKAKRDGYEYDRLEELATDIHDENDTRLEEIINEETTFDLVDYVLGGEEFENIN